MAACSAATASMSLPSGQLRLAEVSRAFAPHDAPRFPTPREKLVHLGIREAAEQRELAVGRGDATRRGRRHMPMPARYDAGGKPQLLDSRRPGAHVHLAQHGPHGRPALGRGVKPPEHRSRGP